MAAFEGYLEKVSGLIKLLSLDRAPVDAPFDLEMSVKHSFFSYSGAPKCINNPS